MSPNSSQLPSDVPVDEERLSALLDGEVSQEERVRLVSAMTEHAAISDRMETWKQIGNDLRQAADALEIPSLAPAITARIQQDAVPHSDNALPRTLRPKQDAMSGQRRLIAVASALVLTLVCAIGLVLVNNSLPGSRESDMASNSVAATRSSSAATMLETRSLSEAERLKDRLSKREDSVTDEMAAARAEPSDFSGSGDSALVIAPAAFDFSLVRMEVDDTGLAMTSLLQSMEMRGFHLSMPEADETEETSTARDRVAIYFNTDTSETKRLLTDLFDDTEGFRSFDWEPVNLKVGTRDEIIRTVIKAMVQPSSADQLFGRPYLVQTADASEDFPGYREMISTLQMESFALRNSPQSGAKPDAGLGNLAGLETAEESAPRGESALKAGDLRRAGDLQAVPEDRGSGKTRDRPTAPSRTHQNLEMADAVRRNVGGQKLQRLNDFVDQVPMADKESLRRDYSTTVSGVVLLLETPSVRAKPGTGEGLNYRLPIPKLHGSERNITDRS